MSYLPPILVTEASIKTIVYRPSASVRRREEVFKLFGRHATANELRALAEIPTRSAYDLNDRSPTGRRIFALLIQYETKHDPLVLEEAGSLLWQQIFSSPPPWPASCFESLFEQVLVPLTQPRGLLTTFVAPSAASYTAGPPRD